MFINLNKIVKQNGRIVLFAIFLITIFSIGFKKPQTPTYMPIAPANIYLYDSLLLISDMNQGVHLYSITNTAKPVYKNTIQLDYNTGVAMKSNVIYANSYGFIYAFKLNDDFTYDTVSVLKSDPDYHHPGHYNGGFSCFPLACSEAVPTNAGSSNGTGGSYALFAVIDTFLYYIDNFELITMSIGEPAKVKELSRTYIDWSIETLFPTEDRLFIGGQRGMYVLDRSNPAHPTHIGTFQHFTAKDPVVVKESIAYVTLRTGNNANNRNVLLVVDISDVTNPQLIKEYPIYTPYGLTIKDSLLYVSNGYNGYTLYDVSNPAAITSIKRWTAPATKDFIWIGNTMYMMGFSNIIMYDVSDPVQPVQLSKIE